VWRPEVQILSKRTEVPCTRDVDSLIKKQGIKRPRALCATGEQMLIPPGHFMLAQASRQSGGIGRVV
jgi:hypothetical protein